MPDSLTPNVHDEVMISELPAASEAHGSDLVEASQVDGAGYTSRRLTIEQIRETLVGSGAPIDSPVFTGDPQAPTPPPGDDDHSIPTTEWVNDAITEAIDEIPPLTWDALIGKPATFPPSPHSHLAADLPPYPTTLPPSGAAGGVLSGSYPNPGFATTPVFPADLAPYALINSPTFTGDPKAPTPAAADNDTSIATTAFVKAQGYVLPATLANYLPLTGGTLTGPLAGTTLGLSGGMTATTGSFSGNLTSTGGNVTASGGAILVDRTGDAAAASVDIRADTGFTAAVYFRMGALARWRLTRTGAAETGSNAGSDLVLAAYDDAGVALPTNPLVITRATGAMTLGGALSGTTGAFSGNVTFPTQAAGTNNTTGATTAFVQTAVASVIGGATPAGPAGGDLAGTYPNPLLKPSVTNGQVMTTVGGVAAWTTPTSGGTVTSVSVASANGLAGTVATATTTPAITLRTTITGLLKGNGTAISAAVAGTDYVDPAGVPTTLPPSGAASGDLAGTYPSPTIKSSVALAGAPTVATLVPPTNNDQTIATTKFVNDQGYLSPALAASTYLPLTGGTLAGPGNLTMAALTATTGTFGGVLNVNVASAATTPVGLTITDTTSSSAWPIDVIGAGITFASSDASGIGAGNRLRFGMGMIAANGSGSNFVWEGASTTAGTLAKLMTLSATGVLNLTGTLFGTTGTFSSNVTTTGGNIVVDRTGDAAAADFYQISDAGFGTNFLMRTGTTTRWNMGKSGTAESGSNVGSDFFFNAHNDAGAGLGSVFTVTRATRVLNFGVSPTAPTPPISSDDTTVATTAFVNSMVPGKTLRQFGAIGNGIANDSTALQAAFTAQAASPGMMLDGEGMTYLSTSTLTMTATQVWLENCTIKDNAPGTGSPRIFISHAGPTTSVILRNVRINRNGTGSEGSLSNRTLLFNACSNLLLEDIEIYGHGGGIALSCATCTNVRIIRPYIHDMNWERATNPLGELIEGIYLDTCTSALIDGHIIKNLTGTVLGVAQIGPVANYQNTDGISCGGCTDVRIVNGFTSNVGEGVDVTGSPNINVRLENNTYYNCAGYGEKFVHGAYECSTSGARYHRCGLGSLNVTNGPTYAPRNFTAVDCIAYDTGVSGVWQASSNVCGIRTDVGAGPLPTNLWFIDCQTKSTTQEYGFLNTGVADAELHVVNFDSSGATVANVSGVNVALSQVTATGRHAFTGGVDVLTAGLTTTTLTATSATFSSGVQMNDGFVALNSVGLGWGCQLSMSATNGFLEEILLRTGAAKRWSFGKTATSEAGANVGSDFYIKAYSDAEADLGNVVTVKRSTGMVTLDRGMLSRGPLQSQTANFTVVDGTYFLNNKAGSTCVVTLPSAALYPQRELHFTNFQPQLLQSASANVVQLGGTATSTAILSAVTGRWCTLVSDGASNWYIVAGVV